MENTDTMAKKERTKPKLRERVWTASRAKILTGIAVLVPIVLTFLVLRTVFRWSDGFAQPLVRQVFQTEGDVPGLGIVANPRSAGKTGQNTAKYVTSKARTESDNPIAKEAKCNGVQREYSRLYWWS